MTISPPWLRWPETQKLITALGAQNMRFVGGAVRDALLRVDVQDIDVATTLSPKEAMAILQKAGVQVVPTGIKHGTITAVIGGKHFEITTLREDISTDGRHAKVKFTEDWEKDASRRDFTMNAMYLSPDGKLFDYFGGETDARAGVVRFIGDPAQRISEDYLRILRFFRFHAHYGAGEPDGAALAACAAQVKKIDTLSGERISHELLKLLVAPRYAKTIDIMREQGALAYALGFAIGNTDIFGRFERMEDALRVHLDPLLKFAGFLFAAGAEISPEDALHKVTKRLKLSNERQRALHIWAKEQKDFAADLPEPEQKRLIRKLGCEHFADALLLNWALSKEKIAANHPYAAMLTLAKEWDLPEFPVRGEDLIALGIKPGKKLGEALKALEEKWEKSGYKLTKKELLNLLSS